MMNRASQIENRQTVKEQNDLFVDSGNIHLSEKLVENKDGGVVEEKKPFNFLPFVLMIALSVHSIFEGIALGLMNDFGPFINLMVSILIHKFAESMSISIAM